MASLNDYLSGANVPGPDADELDKLIKSLRTYRKNQDVGAALGADTDTSPTPGIVSALFDPQTGVISSGGRAIRAGLFDLLGVDLPELKVRNPLESALDAFTGEFEIGTGDVPGLRVKADDNLLTRAAKMGSAFVGDVVTDPISYVGGSGAIGRAGASKLAVKRGSDILETATRDREDSADLIKKLVERTPAGQVAKAQSEAVAAKKITQEELGTASQLDLLDPTSARSRNIAAAEIGNIVGSALLARGRKGVVDDLTDLLGDRATALRVFDELPDTVKGGTFLVNPLTGAPKVRLTSGRGEWFGPVGAAGNRFRFEASRTIGAPVTRQFSGQTGPQLQDAKKAIANAGRKAPTDMESIRLSDWVQYAEGLRNRGADFARLSAPWMTAVGQAFRAQQDAAPEVQEAFRLAFFQPWQAQDLSTPEIAAAVEQATQLREVMRSAWQARRATGLDIGDLGPEWSPLRVTKEEAERQQAASRSYSFDDTYRTERGRNSLVQPVLDAQEGQSGFRVPGRDDIEYADAITANELLGREAYSTDPIQVATEYLQEAANAVATQRFVNAMTDAGILIRDIPESVFALRGRAAASLQGAASRVGQAALRKAAEAEASAEQNLRTTVEAGGQYQEQFLRMRSEAQDRWMVANDDLAVAEREAEEAATRLSRAEPKAARVRDRLRTYAQTGLEDAVSDSERLTRNATVRTNRASDRTAELAEEAARRRAETADFPNREYDMTVGPVEAAAQRTFERFDDASQELARLRVEVDALRTNRDGILDDLSEAQVREVREYRLASENYLAARDRLTAARAAARGARRDLDQVSDLPAIQALTTVDGVVSAYTTRLLSARKDLEVATRSIKTLTGQTEQLKATIRQGRKDGNTEQVKAATARLRDLQKQIDEQVEISNRITGEVKQAEAAIEQAISGGLKLEGPAKEYAEAVIVAANKLSEVQFQAFKVVASETRVRQAIEAIGQAGDDDAIVSAAIKDLVDNYLFVRKALGEKDLKKFSKADRKIIRQVRNVRDVTLQEAKQGFTGRAAVAGGMRAGRGKFRDLYSTHSLQESLERMFMAANDKSESQRILQDYLSPYTLLWRLTATQLRGPAYTFLNMTGAAYNNYLGGVSVKATKVSIGVTWKLAKAMRSSRINTPGITAVEQFEMVRDILKKELGDSTYGGVKLADSMEEFIDQGGFEATQTFESIEEVARRGGAAEAATLSRSGAARYAFTEEATSRTGRAAQGLVNASLTNRFTRFVNDSNQTVEIAARFAAFLDGKKMYGDKQSAMDFMYMLHFDYADLAPLEKWVRVFVPFYTWSRRNLPLQLRSLVLQPSKVSKALYAMEAAEGSFGVQGEDSWVSEVLPEYVQVAGGFATMFDFNGNPITFMSNLPYQDLNKVVQADPMMPIRGREVANMIGPAKGIVGAMSGVDLSSGRPFDPSGTPAPAYLKGLDALTGGNLLARDTQGNALAPEGLAYIINELLPPVGVAERAASGLGSAGVPLVDNLAPTTAQDRGRTNLINFSGLAALLGGSTSTMTPRSIRGELRRRQEVQSGILENAAMRAGVDLQWVRDRLGEGLTPEEVALLIARGEGQVSREGDEPRRLDREKGNELRDALLRMQ